MLAALDTQTFALRAMEAANHVAARRQAVPWREWLAKHFRSYTFAPFADRHVRFWEWVSALEPGVYAQPRVEVWPRGGGKSTTIELGCAYLGSSPTPNRHYVLYVSETQEQADKHVGAIAEMLEVVGIGRALNKYGSSRGWRRAEVRTANRFNVSAFGLDAGMRGIKLDQYRPDVIIFDDIDSRHDTALTIEKKIETITETILPAGSTDCAVIVVQNKVHDDSIVSRLCDGRADFLHDRIPATVELAVIDLDYERVIQDDGSPRYKITRGTPTWLGQDIPICEFQMNRWGEGAFLREAQHDVDEIEGGLWNRERDITPFRVPDGDNLPAMDMVVVGIDPNTTGTGDEAGVIVAGTSYKWNDLMWARPHGYVLADYTVQGGPKVWAEAAVAAYHDYNADLMVAESNNGGEMVTITIETIDDAPAVKLIHASRGKRTRAEPVQKIYADGRVHHVGVLHELEKELCTWEPAKGMESPNRLDAAVWTLTTLMLGGGSDMSGVVEDMQRELD